MPLASASSRMELSKYVCSSCSDMPQMSTYRGSMDMSFRLFRSLKMLTWLNLLTPVMKPKRMQASIDLSTEKKAFKVFRYASCNGLLSMELSNGLSYSSTSTTTCLPVCSKARRMTPLKRNSAFTSVGLAP